MTPDEITAARACLEIAEGRQFNYTVDLEAITRQHLPAALDALAAAQAENVRLREALALAQDDARIANERGDSWRQMSHDDTVRAEAAEARLREAEELLAETATELDRWGYGDMHYGPMPRDASVIAAITKARGFLARSETQGADDG